MPRYDFECENGHVCEVICQYEQTKRARKCEKCGASSTVLFPLNQGTSGIIRSPKNRAYYALSTSAAVHPDQVPEMRKMFPHHDYLDDGTMAFRSRGHRRQCLRDIGMFDQDGGYGDSPRCK